MADIQRIFGFSRKFSEFILSFRNFRGSRIAIYQRPAIVFVVEAFHKRSAFLDYKLLI